MDGVLVLFQKSEFMLGLACKNSLRKPNDYFHNGHSFIRILTVSEVIF